MKKLKMITWVDSRDFLAIVHRYKNYIILPGNDSKVVSSLATVTIIEINDDGITTGNYVEGLISWVEFVGNFHIISFEVSKLSYNNNTPDCPNYHGFPYDKNDHTD